jgi:branched-chain amino acid transport system substrate-binding protein
MCERKKVEQSRGITRREFIKKTGTAGLAIGAATMAPRLVKKSFAAKRDYILIGHPDPSTGALAGLGEPTPWVRKKAVDAMNKDGGIYIKEYGKKVPVKFKVLDTESNPTKAAELAYRLIQKEKVDLMLAMYTPDVVNPVTAVCERNQIPCIGMGVPMEAWLTGGPYKWSFSTHFSVDAVSDLYIGMWDEFTGRTNKVVGGLWPNDADGVEWAKIFKEKLSPKGYKVVDPGRFPYFTKDFTSFINQFKRQKVDILTGCVIPPDFTTFWRQCRQQGFAPKIATIGKALLFPSAMEAMGGDLANGLTTEIWWSRYFPYKSILSGETCDELCESWTKETGKQWTMPVGLTFAGYELVFELFNRAQTVNKEKLREALEKTDMNGIYGNIKYNDENYCISTLVGGQWVKTKKWPWDTEIVYNKGQSEIPITSSMIFPLPK